MGMSQPFLMTLRIGLPIFAIGASLALGLAAKAAETPGPATRPSPVDALPAVAELPDPFLFQDGSRVKTAADWPRRRAELLELVQRWEYGHVPPAPSGVKATEQSWTPPKGAKEVAAPSHPAAPVDLHGAAEHQLLLTVLPDGVVSSHLILTIPQGAGPFPVIVKGDLCWGRVAPQIVAEVVRRGYVLAEFDRTEFAPDKDGRSEGVYKLYPGTDAGGSACWAWGFSRVIDYLVTRPDIDVKKITVTGHSRGGKATLLAGATDGRVALTAPNGSGCGGAGCYRFQAPKSEGIADITRKFGYWFEPHFTDFIGRVDRLPFDQHSVKALVAPRAMLSTEGLGDLWANPQGSQITYTAAKDVFSFLGAADKIGIHFREGKHEQNLEDFTALLDFADKLYFGKEPRTPGQRFDKLAFPDAPKPYAWAAPRG